MPSLLLKNMIYVAQKRQYDNNEKDVPSRHGLRVHESYTCRDRGLVRPSLLFDPRQLCGPSDIQTSYTVPHPKSRRIAMPASGGSKKKKARPLAILRVL